MRDETLALIMFECMIHMFRNVSHSVVFWTGSALKVLGVGDGKIPTKKVKVRVCHRENVNIYLKLSLF